MNAKDGAVSLSNLSGKKLVNQVGYVNRFNEVFSETKRLIEKGVIGDIKTFSSEMYGATVMKDAKSGWRGKRGTGGGCLYEFASHCIDLVIFLCGLPDGVKGSILQSVYSSGVEDIVTSSLIYKNGCTGTIIVSWSDPTYRKPTNIVKISGTKGKIISDKHTYKIFLKDDDPSGQFKKGWNTKYLINFTKGVRFYVRGNEFSHQLDYFIDCIKKGSTSNIASFSESFKTDILIEKIRQDARQPAISTEISRIREKTTTEEAGNKSLWGRFLLGLFKRNG